MRRVATAGLAGSRAALGQALCLGAGQLHSPGPGPAGSEPPDHGLGISAGGAFKHDPLGYGEHVDVGEGATENTIDLSSSSFGPSRFLKRFQRQLLPRLAVKPDV